MAIVLDSIIWGSKKIISRENRKEVTRGDPWDNFDNFQWVPDISAHLASKVVIIPIVRAIIYDSLGLSFQEGLYSQQSWKILLCLHPQQRVIFQYKKYNDSLWNKEQTCILTIIKYLGSLRSGFLSCKTTHCVQIYLASSECPGGTRAWGTSTKILVLRLLPKIINCLFSDPEISCLLPVFTNCGRLTC